jgi:hypothetical protein
MFVSKGKPTALSQYFHFIFFPELLPQKEELQRRIIAFWEEVACRNALL